MKRYWILTASMMAVFLGLFLVVEALRIPILTDPDPWLSRGGPIAALAGIGLLVGDIVLPVPATLVMIAHGALFGIAGGTLVSLAGGLGAGLFGFFLGRRGGPLLDRLMSAEERRRVDAMLAKWGDLAVIVTRPVPIVAETVAILAGASTMRWGRMAFATFAGCLPIAAIYAVTGATARRLDSTVLVFVLVMVVAGLFWAVGRRFAHHIRIAGPRG
jgi:uncharacterized membrane protein YdjX (TVP38/TMEM64 family)